MDLKCQFPYENTPNSFKTFPYENTPNSFETKHAKQAETG